MWKVLGIMLGALVGAALVAHIVSAQNAPMQHPPMQGGQMHGGQMPMPQGSMQHMQQRGAVPAGGPTLPGQDAFGAISEIAWLLEADPQTDWSKVDLERLRQHLIDMNEVVLRSEVKQSPIPGGLVMVVTGAGRTEQAIRAMVVPHAAELDQMPDWSARAELIPGGVRLTVTAKKPDDAKVVARLRGLSSIGLLTEGAHHQRHHLAMAKGEALAGHTH